MGATAHDYDPFTKQRIHRDRGLPSRGEDPEWIYRYETDGDGQVIAIKDHKAPLVYGIDPQWITAAKKRVPKLPFSQTRVRQQVLEILHDHDATIVHICSILGVSRGQLTGQIAQMVKSRLVAHVDYEASANGGPPRKVFGLGDRKGMDHG